jgi:monomeric sarcosine oxidase
VHDVVVVGAGVFGSWTAWHLRRTGRRILLIDAYGVATSRASSGGETRLIRAGYGADVVYTRAARASLHEWKALEAEAGVRLVEPTGVLTLGHGADAQTEATWNTLRSEGASVERLSAEQVAIRVPALAVPSDVWGVFEPEAGILHARRGVEAVAAEAARLGAELRRNAVLPFRGGSRQPLLDAIHTASGDRIRAGVFVFAAGPWLPKLFPDLIGPRMFVTRQEVFFFGPPAGATLYNPDALPGWIDFRDGVYGHGDLGRGVKIAIDRHGPEIDPDTSDRLVDLSAVTAVRRKLEARLPGLARAPLLETRVCQYENSATGDFVIDRHPDFENVWIAGGGSGHGFKHGPFVGDYVRRMIEGTAVPEPRFSLARKGTVQHREVY